MMNVIELTKQLISCPSVTPDDAGCQAIISDYLNKAGFHCESMRFHEVDNLWARYGNAEPLLVFAGHTDVVPTGPEADWTSQPFSPDIRVGKLYGRGACDMKGSLAAMVVAAARFVKQNPQFKGSIAFLITSDEEGPAIHGTEKVIETLQKRGEKIQYCIIGEPGSDTKLGDQIRVGRRGSLHGKLMIEGKQGHVAHPHLAVNPIHQCLLALDNLAKTVWDNGSEHFPATTFQITNIHAGTGAANVIPGHVEVLFNLRHSTALTTSQIERQIEKILHDHHLTFKLEWRIGGHPFLTQQGKLITAVRHAIHKLTGIDTKLSTGGGTSDGRFIAPTGAEVVELGVSHATAHQVDECVDVNDLEKLPAIYQEILSTIFTN